MRESPRAASRRSHWSFGGVTCLGVIAPAGDGDAVREFYTVGLHLLGFQRAFDLQIICFFPDEIQKLDADIALRNARKPRRRRR